MGRRLVPPAFRNTVEGSRRSLCWCPCLDPRGTERKPLALSQCSSWETPQSLDAGCVDPGFSFAVSIMERKNCHSKYHIFPLNWTKKIWSGYFLTVKSGIASQIQKFKLNWASPYAMYKCEKRKLVESHVKTRHLYLPHHTHHAEVGSGGPTH